MGICACQLTTKQKLGEPVDFDATLYRNRPSIPRVNSSYTSTITYEDHTSRKNVGFLTVSRVFGCIFQWLAYRDISRYEPNGANRSDTTGQKTLEKLLTLLQSAPIERDRFVSHLYQSRREYRRACETAGKSGKRIERCVIPSSRSPRAWASRVNFANGSTCCALAIKNCGSLAA